MVTTKEMQNYLYKLTTRPDVLVSDVQPTNNTPNTTGPAYKAAQTVNGVKTSTVPDRQTSIQYFGDAPIGLSALNGIGSTTPKTSSSSGSGGSGGNTSGVVADYKANLNNLYNNVMGYGSYTPGTYSAKYDTSPLEGQLAGWLNEIDNYGEFKYDLNADMLYKQMADNYVQQGQMAMQDAMANAAALSGGYGNSYAAALGNQAYQQHLTALNNNIPALQQQALNVWQAGLDQLYGQMDAGSQQLNNLLALEAQNFAQWQANEANAYNAWLAGYNQVNDQYGTGKDYYSTLMELEKASGGSGSGSTSKKTSSTSGLPASVQNVLNNATQAQLVTAEDWVKLLDAANKKK